MSATGVGEKYGRRCRRATSGCRRIPGSAIKPASVGSRRQTTKAPMAVEVGTQAAVELLRAAVIKPVTVGSRRPATMAGTAVGGGTPSTGADLPAATFGRRREFKVKDTILAAT